MQSPSTPPRPPPFFRSSRSSSWPLDQPNHRMRANRYHLRPRPSRVPSTVSSDDGHLRHRPGRIPSTVSSDDGSAASTRATPELLYAAAAPTQHRRPSRLRVLARLLRQGVLLAAIFYAGIVVGWNQMRRAADARGVEAAATATPASPEKQQYLIERLGEDLQMLHQNPLRALGIMSPPAWDASVEEVEQCRSAVRKRYRKLARVWHPDSCPYSKQGIIAQWQCAELYKALGEKKDKALFDCLN
ncbi:hypothetical protein BC567DRAFT_299647, partial [Phyllosticta citribraziliensis]